MSVRETGRRKPKPFESALPVFSTNTKEEAEELLVFFCRLTYYQNRYLWPYFPGTVEAIEIVTQTLREKYATFPNNS